MEFRLTYEGKLLAHKGGRAGHVHEIRQEFHKQLKVLWDEHPVLKRGHPSGPTIQEPNEVRGKTFLRDGYKWKPIVTESNGLICALDILLLRNGPPGKVRTDIELGCAPIVLRRFSTLYALRVRRNWGRKRQSPGKIRFTRCCKMTV